MHLMLARELTLSFFFWKTILIILLYYHLLIFSLLPLSYIFSGKKHGAYGACARAGCEVFAMSMHGLCTCPHTHAHAQTPPRTRTCTRTQAFFFFPSHPDMCAISVSAELVYLTTQARRTGLKGSVVRNLFALTSRNEST